MAYNPRELDLIGGNAIRIWGYKTADAAAVVDTEGYFNKAADRLQVGDRIELVCNKNGTPEMGRAFVDKVVDGVVDIRDMEAAATTDTD